MNVLGIDIGASTVDLAFYSSGEVRAAKVRRQGPTAVRDIAAAVAHGAARWGFAPAQLDEIRIGSTGAINMLLAKQVARVGLITTSGFGDTLALARQNRAELYNPVARSPSPTFLVEHGAIHEVEGRLDRDGNEIAALCVEQIRRAAERLREQEVEAIAVCFLFSYLNPTHERACADILAAAAPGVLVVLSHEVDGQAREYERTVSTCLEAALRPSQQAVLIAIEQELERVGFKGRLSFADSRGHLVALDKACGRVATQVMGGPAASAWFSAWLLRRQDAARAIAIDVGSTSTDIVFIEGAAPLSTTHGVVAGIPLRTGMLDIESIAVGGGARVASVETPGVRFSQDAPADAPSVTDALALLGELPHDLAPDAAARLQKFAGEAGIDPAEFAHRIRDAAVDRIASSVLRHAVSRNVDPAAVPLIANGGLGPVLGCAIAERLGTRDLLAGLHSFVSGATGLLLARHLHEAAEALNTPLDGLGDDALRSALARLRDRNPQAAHGRLYLTIAPNAFMHPVRLPLAETEPTVQTLRSAFSAYHADRFGGPSREPGFVFTLAHLHLEDPLDFKPAADATAFADVPVPPGWDSTIIGELTHLVRKEAGVALRPETLQMRLNAIAQSMQEILFKTAVSPVVREGNDASAGLLTPDGELIALSDAIPLLLGALDGSARAILARFPPETMREGDLYLMNDPFLGGTHLPDLTVMRPVLVEGRLIAFAASILHHQDVGGMRAGSVPPDAIDIFQEGLRLPPMKIGSGDRIDREIVDLIRANSRAPETVLGDLSSQVSAAIRAASSLRKLATESGVDTFLSGMAACLDRGERLARETIATMAPGPHLATERLDPTPGLPEVEIALTLICANGRFVADFEGTTPQVAAPINCVRSGPFAAAFYSLLSAMGDTMFRNGGVVRTIDLVLPEDCAINASPPAAVNARMGIVRAATSSLLHGLARALPQRMPAANSGMSYVLAFSGAGAGGREFIVTEIIAGGAGGGPAGDGASGISTDVGNAMNMPAEALESQIPVRLAKAEIRRGSGGSGRFRGGDGIRRSYLALQDGVSVSLRGERFRHVPEGLAGGGSPQSAAAHVVRADGSIERLGTRSTPVLSMGDLLVVESCGGAGYGVTEERLHS